MFKCYWHLFTQRGSLDSYFRKIHHLLFIDFFFFSNLGRKRIELSHLLISSIERLIFTFHQWKYLNYLHQKIVFIFFVQQAVTKKFWKFTALSILLTKRKHVNYFKIPQKKRLYKVIFKEVVYNSKLHISSFLFILV